jgi:hypothetical protein
LSIVIPVLGNNQLLEQGLVSVLENRPDDCQVILVLNGPYDDPYRLEGEVEFVRAQPHANWARCAEAGLAACKGDVVHLLAAGGEVAPGWTDNVLPHFEKPDVAAVAPLVFDLGEKSLILAAGVEYLAGGVARWRAPTLPPLASGPVLGPCRLAAFWRRSAVADAGGFCARLGAYADVDLALRLRRGGMRCILEPASRTYVPKPRRLSAFQTGLGQERLFWRAASATGWLSSLAQHPFTVTGELVGQLASGRFLGIALGRLCGLSEVVRLGSTGSSWASTAARPRSAVPPSRDPGRIDPVHATSRTSGPLLSQRLTSIAESR